ncbi:hypothetical protein C8R45DRAFT_1181691 [Mycena sanguinolenta]|nr:hypothetical protein C8R45DRAFT_1181691 [Mycena sanguinolenta]
MPRLQLLDLPTELLLSILEWVESESLYQLALLSRRLNSIALRIYFRRHKLSLDCNDVEFTLGARDVLSAFIQSLDHIHCRIPHYPSHHSLAPVRRHIKRLENFISPLTCVRRVTLHLASHEGNWPIKLKSVNKLCAWSSHVGDLLNCIVKRGCQRLNITDDRRTAPLLPIAASHQVFLSADPEFVEHFLAPTNALPELYTLRVECGVYTDLRLPTLLILLAQITPKLNVHPRTPHLNTEIDLRSTDAELSLGIPPAVVTRQDIAAGRARVTGLTLHLNVTGGGDFTHAEAVAQLAAFFHQTALLSLHTGGVTPSVSAMA